MCSSWSYVFEGFQTSPLIDDFIFPRLQMFYPPLTQQLPRFSIPQIIPCPASNLTPPFSKVTTWNNLRPLISSNFTPICLFKSGLICHFVSITPCENTSVVHYLFPQPPTRRLSVPFKCCLTVDIHNGACAGSLYKVVVLEVGCEGQLCWTLMSSCHRGIGGIPVIYAHTWMFAHIWIRPQTHICLRAAKHFYLYSA